MPGFRTRILVVDQDPAAAAVVRSILRSQDWEVLHCRSAAEALEKVGLEAIDAVITEFRLRDMSGTDLCQALRRRTEMANTPILVLSASAGVAERMASLRAGATDYLVKPPDAQELVARLKAALDLRQERAGFLVALLGGKGGVGTSVIAINLAVALRHETRRGVAIVGASIPAGTADVMLNLQTNPGVGGLLARKRGLEPEDLEAALSHHATGVDALMLHTPGGNGVGPEELHVALLALRRMRELIVVDAGSSFDDSTAEILELADRMLLVLTPDITALRGARVLIERARQAGFPPERVSPLLNRYPQRSGLHRRQIESALGMPIRATLPDDVRLVTYSINRGVPLVESHRRSRIGRQMTALAREILASARPGEKR
ncbi:MAG: response regulator [Anaerolineae bacterium]|nr:response regulator [Anaerolineae bacterium]